MSWMQKLYRTYESILEQGVTDDTEQPPSGGCVLKHAITKIHCGV